MSRVLRGNIRRLNVNVGGNGRSEQQHRISNLLLRVPYQLIYVEALAPGTEI